MENKKEKKGLFKRFMGSKKAKKSPCCGGFEIEEILEETAETDNEKKSKEMITLKIEWKHLDVEGDTCDRCYDTGENLASEVKSLNRALQPKGIDVVMIESKLDGSDISQSNIILFNGVPIEDILNIKVSNNYCDSCSTLLKTDIYCRTVTYEGNEYEDIPAKAIREAAYKALGIEEKAKAPVKNCGCGCNGGNCC